MDRKKILTIVGIILLIILLIVGCLVGNEEAGESNTQLSNNPQDILSNAQRESKAVKEDEQGDYTEIDIDKYLEYYNAESEKLVLIARPTCTYCQIAEPILKKIIKEYNIEINYLNTDNLKGEDTEKFTSSDEEFSNGFGTPMLLVVGQGKIIDKVDGLTDTAHYIDFLKNYNFIK